MKTIIAGSRTIADIQDVITAVLESGFVVTEVVSGVAKGADLLGEDYAKTVGVPVKRFPANWRRDGKAAGFLRNREMAKYAEALIAVWDGKSKGTADMIKTAKQRGLKVFVYNTSGRSGFF